MDKEIEKTIELAQKWKETNILIKEKAAEIAKEYEGYNDLTVVNGAYHGFIRGAMWAIDNLI